MNVVKRDRTWFPLFSFRGCIFSFFLTDATKLIGSIQSCGLKLGLEDSASGLVQPARIRRSWQNGFFINCWIVYLISDCFQRTEHLYLIGEKGKGSNAIAGGAIFASYSDTLATGLAISGSVAFASRSTQSTSGVSITSQDAGRYSEGNTS